MAVLPRWVGRVSEAVVERPVVKRQGFEFGIPPDSWNDNGSAALMQQQSRRETLQEYYDVYMGCVWVSRPVNTVAKRITAGGVELKPVKSSDNTKGDPARPAVLDELEALLNFINPTEDPMQFFRRVASELLIFGDSYCEVAWVLGKPVALFGLDPITMVEDCDEHGTVTGYRQVTADNREADFDVAPTGTNYSGSTVIHWSLDAPRGGQYGVSPVAQAMIPATAWIWNATCIKESARRGHPGRMHANFPPGTAPKTVDQWVRQTFTKVLGARNVGTPYTTINAPLSEVQANRLLDLQAIANHLRDEIIGCFGTSPATVGIVESGNLGGGTGEAQDKNLRIVTAVPLEAIILEKFNYHVTQTGFGITEWKVVFGEIDYRDSKTIEEIRQIRSQFGAWSTNRWRADIGEPDVEGGDDPYILTRQGPVFVADLADYSAAMIDGLEAKAAAPTAPGQTASNVVPMPKQRGGNPSPSKGDIKVVAGDPNPNDMARESVADDEMRRLTEAFSKAYRHRRRKALSEANRATVTPADDGTPPQES